MFVESPSTSEPFCFALSGGTLPARRPRKSSTWRRQTMALPSPRRGGHCLGFFLFCRPPTAAWPTSHHRRRRHCHRLRLTLTFLPAVLVLITEDERASVGSQWARPVNKQLLKHRRWCWASQRSNLACRIGAATACIRLRSAQAEGSEDGIHGDAARFMQDPWATPKLSRSDAVDAPRAMPLRLAALPEVRKR